MNAHLKRCKDNSAAKANKRQKVVTLGVEGQAGGSSPNLFKFDQEAGQKALVEMFVVEEQPF